MTIPISAGAARRRSSGPQSNVMLYRGTGGYAGASSAKRALRNWFPLSQSADSDTLPDLPTLRSRSRDLVRNSPIAGGAIGTVTTSVVGAGLQLQAAIDRELLGLTPEEAEAWQVQAERIWKHWCGRADIRQRQHFLQMQDLVFRAQLESGDILVVRRRKPRAGDLLGLKLQLVEADRVGTPPERAGDLRVCDGVEADTDGAPIAFWVRNRHPQELGQVAETWSRVTVLGAQSRSRQVLHIADMLRPGQTRGVPYLSPVIEPLKQLERFTEAEIAAAVVTSFFTVFTKTEGAEGMANETANTAATDDGTVDSETRDLELAPGAILDLDPGEEIQIADPKRPNGAFEPFVEAVMTQIGMRLEVPKEVLAKHFRASYSAARGAIVEAWRFFKKRRHWLALDLCAPVYEWVIEEAVLRNYLDAPGFMDDPIARQAWLGALWIGPPQGHVDPMKEIGAYQEMKAEGWISDSEATQEIRGQAFDDVTKRRQGDARVLEDAGLAAPERREREPATTEPEPNPDLLEEEDAA